MTPFLKKCLVLLLAAFSISAASASTGDSIPQASKSERIEAISSAFFPWQSVMLEGKLRMAGLPVAPSVKVYMVHDSLVRISVRAPFLGEVARAEINDSSLTAINRKDRTYISEPIDSLRRAGIGGLAEIQNILLGRVVIAGHGVLSPEMEEAVEIFGQQDGSSLLTVSEGYSVPGVQYGYVLDDSDLVAAILVIPDSIPDSNITVAYSWYEHGYDMEAAFSSPKRNIRATLEFDNPLWGAEGFAPASISSKYRRVNASDLLKIF